MRAPLPRTTTTPSGAWLYVRPGAWPDGTPRLHAGVDLPGSPGEIVVAPEAGRVVGVHHNEPPWSGYGPRTVVIRGDASGLYHVLAHVEMPIVSVGDQVAEGDAIARVDASIRPPHVHWEVRAKILPDYARGEYPFHISLDPLALAGGRRVAFDALTSPLAGWRGPVVARNRHLLAPGAALARSRPGPGGMVVLALALLVALGGV